MVAEFVVERRVVYDVINAVTIMTRPLKRHERGRNVRRGVREAMREVVALPLAGGIARTDLA